MEFQIADSGPVPQGWRLASTRDVRNNLDNIKTLLLPHEWHILALTDGSISGPGYEYELKQGAHAEPLGHQLLVKAPEFQIATNGVAPFGWRMSTCQEVADNLQEVKALLGAHPWHICALADGSISGPGYQYALKREPPAHGLGHMLITKT